MGLRWGRWSADEREGNIREKAKGGLWDSSDESGDIGGNEKMDWHLSDLMGEWEVVNSQPLIWSNEIDMKKGTKKNSESGVSVVHDR